MGGIAPVAVLAGASEPLGSAQSVSSLLRNAPSAMPPIPLPEWFARSTCVTVAHLPG